MVFLEMLLMVLGVKEMLLIVPSVTESDRRCGVPSVRMESKKEYCPAVSSSRDRNRAL